MRQTDVAIVGGGLAGSTAAAVLGRAGVSTILVDPHQQYPKDFRCEKLDTSQVALLRKTGIAEPVLRAATPDLQIWVARYGQLVDQRPHGQYDILYDTLVNAVRAEIPGNVAFIHAKAAGIATSVDRQQLTLSNGEEISARLIVLANGLNIGLRQNVGIGREILSECHSISIGFDIKPVGRPTFDFRALTYFPERAADRMAYVTLFPIGSTMRANLFVYRDMHDPWLRDMRRGGQEALFALAPGLRNFIGDVEITDVKIRPVDLYLSTGCVQPGIALVGDAFATSCPAAGTGCNKVFTDVERLCNVHIPDWLASPGMGAEKIAAFYDDPDKVACDEWSEAKAFYLRLLSTETGVTWRARRFARYAGRLGLHALRQVRERALARTVAEHGTAADTARAP